MLDSIVSPFDSYGVEVYAGGAFSEGGDAKGFSVRPRYEAMFEVPSNPALSTVMPVRVTLTNRTSGRLDKVHVRLVSPDAYNEPLFASRHIAAVPAGQSVTLQWTLVPAARFRESRQRFIVEIQSDNGGDFSESFEVRYHLPPTPVVTRVAGDWELTRGTTERLTYSVHNAGNDPLTDTVVTLALPPVLSTAQPLQKALGTLAPGASTTVSWDVRALQAGAGLVMVRATDASGAYRQEATELFFILATSPGDLNGSGTVGLRDLAILLVPS